MSDSVLFINSCKKVFFRIAVFEKTKLNGKIEYARRIIFLKSNYVTNVMRYLGLTKFFN